jgi:hypothetical protein
MSNLHKVATIFFITVAWAMIAILWLPNNSLAEGPDGTLTNVSHNVDKSATDANGLHHWPGVFKMNFGGTDVGAFCVDVHTLTYNNTHYKESSKALPCEIAWILHHYPPELQGLSTTEAAARQAAIWHFSDNGLFVNNRPEVIERAWQIINSIPANPCADIPGPATIEFIAPPANSKDTIGNSFTLVISVKQGDKPFANATIKLKTNFGELGSSTVTTGPDGTAKVTINSSVKGVAEIIAELEYEYMVAVRLQSVESNRQFLARLKPVYDKISTKISVEWTGTTLIKRENSDFPLDTMWNFVGPKAPFTLKNGGSTVIGTPGVYKEVAPESCKDPQFILYDVICTDEGGKDYSINKNISLLSADIPVEPGENLTCTYDNRIPWRGSFEPSKPLCEYEPQWVTSTAVVTIPGYMTPPFFVQVDGYVVNPKEPFCPPEHEICTDHRYQTIMITQTGVFTFEVVAWWPGIHIGDAVIENHYGLNVLDSNKQPLSCGIGRDIYWYPHICPAPNVLLSVEPPEVVAQNTIVDIPVYLNDVQLINDIQGGQFSLKIDDTSILIPATDATPQLGGFFSADSFLDAVNTTDSWSVVVMSTKTVSGTGIVVNLPFKAVGEGCTTLQFVDHKLSNSIPNYVPHDVNKAKICVRAANSVSGEVYLQAGRDYSEVMVQVSNEEKSYTTYTSKEGQFKIPNVLVGSYAITVTRSLYVPAVREMNLTHDAPALFDIGLWAGDMNQDGQVTTYDQKIMFTGIYPVDNPEFDINQDGTTDILDLGILTQNLNRANMTTTNAPKHQGRESIPQPELPDTLRSAESDFILSLTVQENGEMALSTSQTMVAAGAKIVLSEETTVTDVELQTAVGDGFLHWIQVDNLLYISALPAEGSRVATNSELVRIRTTGADDMVATIEAENVEVIIPTTSENSYKIHLPIIIR